ncbi:MAG: FKBP-type peptidyl-prolyl cis-trans isomerase [Deltaproteobacteria bacterium]|nr:FKBP-type peptidyl-prolyl cis-trans isomerase [Deltaproteobacteria bacterium]
MKKLCLVFIFALAACSNNSKEESPSTSTNAKASVQTPTNIPPPADVAAPPADAERTDSGLASKVLTPGTGDEKPTAADTVVVHYTGWTTDGRMFDSSIIRGQPARFPLRGVIPGWTEGLQLMKVGEKRRFWIPPKLAYGETPSRPGAPAGMLVFDVELQKIIATPKPLPAPPNVNAPPRDAKATPSGLKYRILQKGHDPRHPKATDVVEVHYTGWTTDGRMFDSSVVRGKSAIFPLDRVIPGWTEGLQLMTVGEKCRFWIPAKLAYGEKPARPGAPAGMLVFDVELINIR